MDLISGMLTEPMKDQMYKNILILEAGGPCGIACIKLLRKIPGINLIAVDMDQYASGLEMATKSYVIPPAKSEKFKGAIEKIIKENNVDAIFPCFEFGYKELLGIDANFLIDLENAIRFKDKYNFINICKDNGYDVPETTLLTETSSFDQYPVYLKPRSGVGSKNNYVAKNKDELELIRKLINNSEEYIVQSFIDSDHWNIDVLVDNGKFICAVPRKDIMQKAGNPFTLELTNYKPLIDFASDVQKKFNIKFPFNLEVFETSPGKFVMGEINTRFGNGVVFTAKAGIDMVSYLATKDDKYIGILKEGVYSRYLEEIEINLQKSIHLE